jgi:hypothetical protein
MLLSRMERGTFACQRPRFKMESGEEGDGAHPEMEGQARVD